MSTWSEWVVDEEAGTSAVFGVDWSDDHAFEHLRDELADVLTAAVEFLSSVGGGADGVTAPSSSAETRELAETLDRVQRDLVRQSAVAADESAELHLLRLSRRAFELAEACPVEEWQEQHSAEFAEECELGLAVELLAAWSAEFGPAVLVLNDWQDTQRLVLDAAAAFRAHVEKNGTGSRWTLKAGPGWVEFCAYGYDSAPDLLLLAPSTCAGRETFAALLADSPDGEGDGDPYSLLVSARLLADEAVVEKLR